MPVQEVDPAQAWIANMNTRINKLNKAPEYQVFEVEQPGILLAGDAMLAKSSGDEFELEMENIKPGVWKLVKQDDSELLLGWFADGPLKEDLPAGAWSFVPEVHGGFWEEMGNFSVESGTAAILDRGTIGRFEATEGVGRQVAIETLTNPEWEFRIVDSYGFCVPGGVIMQGNDGVYEISGHRNEEGEFDKIRINFA